jgi:hypothetical protein
MPDHTVTIKESGGVCAVDIPQLHTKKGKTVAIRNETGDRIAIFFPEKELFSELTQQHTVIELLAGASLKEHTVQGAQQGKKGNHYAYAVFCHSRGEFAVANSNPVIIIDH